MKNNLHSEVKENKLLSICIPTFNRAQYLKNTLNNIIEQKKFSESCEIIISDNNSTDKTRDVGEYFSEKYENVRYYCNETNIGAERNFLKLLNYGQGKYLKLHNDRACFYENKLNELVEYLEHIDHSVIFLLNGHTKHKNNEIIECQNFNAFVQIVSFWSTWMAGIIFKNSDYMNLKEKDRAIGSELLQTDIMFRLISQSRKSLIINKKTIHIPAVPLKGGYNFFEVLICNYLSLYDDYLNNGLLDLKTYKMEKAKLLKYLILPKYTEVVLMNSKKYRFHGNRDAKKIFLKYFGYKSLLFLLPVYIMFMLPFNNINSLLRANLVKLYRRSSPKWQRRFDSLIRLSGVAPL